MAISHKTTDQSLQQLWTDASKESTGTAGQAGGVVVNPDGSNVGGGGGSGGAVTIADGANVSQGAIADTAYSSGSGTVISVLKGIFARLRGGQATMANSMPVTVASDQSSLPVTTADGGQITIGAVADAAYASGSGSIVSVLKGIFTRLAGTLTTDVSDRAVRLLGTTTAQQGIGLEVTGSASALNADTVASTDVSAYRFVSIQLYGTFSGTLSPQGSNDNSNWFAVPVVNVTSQANGMSYSFNSLGMYVLPVTFKYFRLRCTAYTSGTLQTICEFYYSATPLNTFGVTAGQYGTWTTQPIAGTVGGWSRTKYLAQTTTVQTLKGTAGNLGGYDIYNPNASVAYLQLFDVASATSVTLGTTVPDLVIGVPATSAARIEYTDGIAMTNGMKLACTATARACLQSR